MDQAPLREQIVAAFPSMTPQLQLAARYVLDNPRDVALLSMRQQAHQAKVQPATMTRLAQHLGLAGYEEVRQLYAQAMRVSDLGFADKAGTQVTRQKRNGDRVLVAAMVDSIRDQITRLAQPDIVDRLIAAAKLLASARRIYCLGMRACHPVAWHLYYISSLLGDRSILLDSIAGTGTDAIRGATAKDVLVVASVLPYTRYTVEVTRYVAARGVPVIAITDSEVAPLAQIAEHTLPIGTDCPSFFHTMSPAFAVAEILAALLAGRGGDATLTALRRMEEHFTAMSTHINERLFNRES